MTNIRSFDTGDLDACVSLFLDVFSRPPWNDRWPSQDSARAYLRDVVGTPGFRGYVAHVNGRIVGACLGHVKRWWAGDEFMIDEMFVAPDIQRRGVGSAMLKAAEADLRASGVHRLTLLTARRTVAEHFYRKQGFSAHRRMAFMWKAQPVTRAR